MSESAAPRTGHAAVTDETRSVDDDFPQQVRHELTDFLAARDSEITQQGAEVREWLEHLWRFLQRGKFLRPRFAYLGWLARAEGSTAALRAAASFELLHAFALIQDDVMDESRVRRGQPTVHRALSASHADPAPSRRQRFGESAATLLADLCLVWAGQMLHTCGLPTAAVGRAYPYYDSMRQELAVGQYLDLRSTYRTDPSAADAFQIARMKSARYTVTGPLVVGASLAGAEPAVRRGLGYYGDAIGEAFQMRDDLLGLFGDPAVTGKPADGDLGRGTVTTAVTMAFERADPTQRQALRRLLDEPSTDSEHVARLRELVLDTGAAAALDAKISERVEIGTRTLHTIAMPESSRTELTAMARACTIRSQ